MENKEISKDELIKLVREKYNSEILGVTYRGSNKGEFRPFENVTQPLYKNGRTKLQLRNLDNGKESEIEIYHVFHNQRKSKNSNETEKIEKTLEGISNNSKKIRQQEKDFYYDSSDWVSKSELNSKLEKAGVKVNTDAYKNTNFYDVDKAKERPYVFTKNGELFFNREKDPVIYLKCKKHKHNLPLVANPRHFRNINIYLGAEKINVGKEKIAPKLSDLLKRIEEKSENKEETRWCSICAGPNAYGTKSDPIYETQMMLSLRKNFNRFLRKNYGAGVQNAKFGVDKFSDEGVSYDGYLKLEKPFTINDEKKSKIDEIRFQFDGDSNHIPGTRVMENDFYRFTQVNKHPNILYITKTTKSPVRQEKQKENKGLKSITSDNQEYTREVNQILNTLKNLFKPIKLRGEYQWGFSSKADAENRRQEVEKKVINQNTEYLNNQFNSTLEKIIQEIKNNKLYNYSRVNPDGSKTLVHLKDFLNKEEGKKSVLDNGKEWGKLFAMKNTGEIQQWLGNHKARVGEIDFKNGIYPGKKLFEEIKRKTSK